MGFNFKQDLYIGVYIFETISNSAIELRSKTFAETLCFDFLCIRKGSLLNILEEITYQQNASKYFFFVI